MDKKVGNLDGVLTTFLFIDNTGRKYGHLRRAIIVVMESDYIWGYNDNAVLC